MNENERSYRSITKGYGVITRSYNEWEWEGVGTRGLDWLGRGKAAGLVPLAWLSPQSFPS